MEDGVRWVSLDDRSEALQRRFMDETDSSTQSQSLRDSRRVLHHSRSMSKLGFFLRSDFKVGSSSFNISIPNFEGSEPSTSDLTDHSRTSSIKPNCQSYISVTRATGTLVLWVFTSFIFFAPNFYRALGVGLCLGVTFFAWLANFITYRFVFNAFFRAPTYRSTIWLPVRPVFRSYPACQGMLLDTCSGVAPSMYLAVRFPRPS